MANDVNSSIVDNDDTRKAVVEEWTAANAPRKADELAQQLRAERFIKIFVGDAAEPYLIQQAVLEQTSEFFVKAIKNEHLGGQENIGTLRFPEDDEEVWKVLLSWIVRRAIPASLHEEASAYAAEDYQKMYTLLVECWAIGEKYLMPEFQNSVMLILLHLLEMAAMRYLQAAKHLSWDNIKLIFELSLPAAKIRTVAAMSVVQIYKDKDILLKDPFQQRHLEYLVGLPSAFYDFITVRDSHLLLMERDKVSIKELKLFRESYMKTLFLKDLPTYAISDSLMDSLCNCLCMDYGKYPPR